MAVYFKALALASCCAALSTTGASAAVFADVTGAGAGFTNLQPSLALGQYIQSGGGSYYPSRDDRGSGAPGYIGQIRTFSYTSSDYFLNPARGSVSSFASDTALYSVVGTSYGGNGQSTFGLPDLQARTMIGAGASANGPTIGNYLVGSAVGENTTVMTVAQMARHDHGAPGGGDSGDAGGGMPINNQQASLAITYGIVANGGYTPGGNGRGFVGEIQAFAGTYTPNGLLPANGQLVTIADYGALFSLIGTSYGGDGVTNFRVPDLTGRSAVGVSTLADATHLKVGLGEATGSTSITLTEANLPTHSHDTADGLTGAAGNGTAFSTTQPSLGINYIINGQGRFPGFPGGAMYGDYLLGEISAYAGKAGDLPAGWMVADGSLLSVSQYSNLLALIGTTYGGDGISTFALPDLRGRTIVGAESTSRSGTSLIPGQVLGQSSVTLNVSNLPAHSHALPDAPVAAVPEPATWAMMLIGFGIMGGAMRRRRHKVAVTYA